jgi:hypothetical protein
MVTSIQRFFFLQLSRWFKLYHQAEPKCCGSKQTAPCSGCLHRQMKKQNGKAASLHAAAGGDESPCGLRRVSCTGPWNRLPGCVCWETPVFGHHSTRLPREDQLRRRAMESPAAGRMRCLCCHPFKRRSTVPVRWRKRAENTCRSRACSSIFQPAQTKHVHPKAAPSFLLLADRLV